MKRKSSDGRSIGILREQEAGAATADVCRKHGVSSATFDKWTSPPESGRRRRGRHACAVHAGGSSGRVK